MKTLASFFVSLVFSFVISFILVVILPGTFESDEVQLVSSVQRQNDLNFSNLLSQYFTGSWGNSWLAPDESVFSIIFESAKMTFGLQLLAFIICIFLSVAISYLIVSNSRVALKIIPILRILASLPLLLWMPLILWLTCFWLEILPFRYNETWVSWLLPLMGLSLKPIAVSTLLLSERWKNTMGEDFVRTAIAKGLRYKQVLFRHGFRNSLMVYVTNLIQFATHLLTGSVLIESLFSWPGLGTLFIDGLKQRDTPVLMGVVFILTFITLFIQLSLRAVHKILDPRLST